MVEQLGQGLGFGADVSLRERASRIGADALDPAIICFDQERAAAVIHSAALGANCLFHEISQRPVRLCPNYPDGAVLIKVIFGQAEPRFQRGQPKV